MHAAALGIGTLENKAQPNLSIPLATARRVVGELVVFSLIVCIQVPNLGRPIGMRWGPIRRARDIRVVPVATDDPCFRAGGLSKADRRKEGLSNCFEMC